MSSPTEKPFCCVELKTAGILGIGDIVIRAMDIIYTRRMPEQPLEYSRNNIWEWLIKMPQTDLYYEIYPDIRNAAIKFQSFNIFLSILWLIGIVKKKPILMLPALFMWFMFVALLVFMTISTPFLPFSNETASKTALSLVVGIITAFFLYLLMVQYLVYKSITSARQNTQHGNEVGV